MPRTMIEPFRIKSIEPIRMTTPQERLGMLEAAKLNVFQLRAEDVLLDWLTDSGTGAMSSAQWAAIMLGDESYAGAKSFFRLEAVLQDLPGMPHLIPTHQGRAAEKVLFSAVCKQGELVPNNSHFDTTRANLEFNGVEALDLVIEEGLHPSLIHPFKGNIDLARVEATLKAEGHRIPFGMITVTNNTGGGQPVSMANLRAYSALLKRYGKPLIMDVCRFAENAMFIKLREDGYQDTPVRAICQEMFSYADGATMSAKKDAMVNMGGFIMLRHDDWLDPVRNMLILTEGFPTYGGLAGRDLEAMWPVVRELGLGVCLDLGHMLERGQEEFLDLPGLWAHTRMLHLNAPDPAKPGRHAALDRLDPAGRALLGRMLGAFAPGGSVVLELFSPGELFDSLRFVSGFWAGLSARAKETA